MTGSDQVTELWRHKRYSLRPSFQRNRLFGNLTCRHWLEWRHYPWVMSEDDHIWPLTLHVYLQKVIRAQWPWLHTHKSDRTGRFWDFLCSWDRKCGSYFAYACLSCSLTLSDDNQGHWSGLPTGDLFGVSNIFPSLYATASQIFAQDTVAAYYCIKTERGTRWRILCSCV